MTSLRVCTKCGRKFEPSSRHRKCPVCRSEDKPKVSCVDCGKQIRNDRKRCRRCSSKGPNNGAWKGGKTYHKKGYVMVYAPGHPRASKRSYVFEHILVMEEKLGRPLEPDETVHHKNTLRFDNSPENLELWVGSQPTGGRVSDLVDWAKKLLARYEPESLVASANIDDGSTKDSVTSKLF